MRKKSLWIVIFIAAASAAGYGYYVYTKKELPPTIATAKVTRGVIAETVGATGQLQAVTTVQVGTQVSGTVQQLNADFNSLVHKGQVIARLDPSLFQTQIEQAKANLIRSQADLQRLNVAVDDARSKLKLAQDLAAKSLIPQADLETAEVAVRSADAQLQSQQAAVTQSQAALQQNQVNLEHTIITAPIDGLVISRNVDVGQTVAASMSAPTLFILAADLTKMQVIASLDESDVGRIRPGQVVRFRVDAYPNEEFVGAVTQVRLQPTTVQNVVTYSTVIDVPNPDLKLKPGMTANVNIEIARRDNVLRVPNAALRFRPTPEIFQALGQTPPAGGGGGGGRGRGGAGGANPSGIPAPSGTDSSTRPPQPAGATATNGSTAPPSGTSGTQAARAQDQAQGQGQRRRRNSDQTAQNGGGSTPSTTNSGDSAGRGGRGGAGQAGSGGGAGGGGGRGNFQERMANMTPEERQQFMDRMRARGFDPEAMMAGRGGGGSRQDASGGSAARSSAAGQSAANGQSGNRGGTASWSGQGRQTKATADPPAAAGRSSATTIDALFGPLPPTESFGQVWLYQNGKLNRVPLRLGITDGTQTELIRGDLTEGQDVVTSVVTAAQRAATNAGSTAFPGFQQGRGGFQGGGGFPGGGGNRGGGGGRGGR